MYVNRDTGPDQRPNADPGPDRKDLREDNPLEYKCRFASYEPGAGRSSHKSRCEGVALLSLSPGWQKGFYNLQGVGDLYLEPGYTLTVGLDKDSNYLFSGKGSLENNLAAEARKKVNDYFSMGPDGFLYETYNIGIDTFLQRMDAYKTAARLLVDQSSSDWFKTIEKKDIDFYCLGLTTNYFIFYGIDSVREDNFTKMAMSGHKKLIRR